MRKRFGSSPEEHRQRGITSARRAIKLARAAERVGCGGAPGMLITAAMYAGRAEAEAAGQQVGIGVNRRNRLAYKTADRAEKAVKKALVLVKAKCFK